MQPKRKTDRTAQLVSRDIPISPQGRQRCNQMSYAEKEQCAPRRDPNRGQRILTVKSRLTEPSEDRRTDGLTDRQVNEKKKETNA